MALGTIENPSKSWLENFMGGDPYQMYSDRLQPWQDFQDYRGSVLGDLNNAYVATHPTYRRTQLDDNLTSLAQWADILAAQAAGQLSMAQAQANPAGSANVLNNWGGWEDVQRAGGDTRYADPNRWDQQGLPWTQPAAKAKAETRARQTSPAVAQQFAGNIPQTNWDEAWSAQTAPPESFYPAWTSPEGLARHQAAQDYLAQQRIRANMGMEQMSAQPNTYNPLVGLGWLQPGRPITDLATPPDWLKRQLAIINAGMP